MTTEEIVEKFLEEGRKAFINTTSKKSPEIRALIRHEAVTIDGVEYNCLQELVVAKTADYIHAILPDCRIDVDLDGNDSSLSIELSDDERRKLTTALYVFLKDNRCIA
jgi:hypothetical protein